MYNTELVYVTIILAEKQFHMEEREFIVADWWYIKPAPIQYIITNVAYIILR